MSFTAKPAARLAVGTRSVPDQAPEVLETIASFLEERFLDEADRK